MKLSVKKVSFDGSPTEAIMEHNGETLSWNIALFDRMTNGEQYNIFEYINKYWEHISTQHQDNVFEIYKQIKAVYDTVWDTDKLSQDLQDLVAKLFNEHKLEDIDQWVKFYSDIIEPIGLRDMFKEQSAIPSQGLIPLNDDVDIDRESYFHPGTRERTYLKEDYHWLIILSIAVRTMIPIWGEFIARTKREAGTHFKEYYAFNQLLNKSSILTSEPMERLRIYIEHSLPSDKSQASAIVGGMSSSEIPIRYLALIVIRKLCVVDVSGRDQNYSIVTTVYKFLSQKVKGQDNNFIGIVKEKIIEGQGSDGENNLSVYEGYKIKQDISAGNIGVLNHYLDDVAYVVLGICPDINPKLVEDCIESTRMLESERIWKSQIVIAQWVLASRIPPRGLMYMNKRSMLRAIGYTEAILWHKGYHELAGLISGIEIDSSDELQLIGNDSRSRITREQVVELDRLFPYLRKPTGKQKVLKAINPAVETIESTAKLFGEREWRLTLPNEMIEKLTGNVNNTRYATPYNIKNILADLVIKIADRKFTTVS